MKVSWRNAGEDKGTFDHHHIFMLGEKHNGMGPLAFMLYLIRETQAIELALNDKPIWSTSMYAIMSMSTEEQIIRAMMGEPRQASALVTVDYNVQGDWIDYECRSCGRLFGTHLHCKLMSDIDKGWIL